LNGDTEVHLVLGVLRKNSDCTDNCEGVTDVGIQVGVFQHLKKKKRRLL